MASTPPPKLVIPPEHPFRRMEKEARYAASKIKRSAFFQLGCCALIVLLNISFLFLPGAERIENFFHDYFFRFRKHIPAQSDIVLIEIAEDSIQSLGRWPWPRQYHAVMTHLLHDWGAKAIIFDMIFSEPSTPFDDGALTEALKESGNAYIPLVSETKGDQKIWIRPLPEMQKYLKGTGHINIKPDSDGTLRRIQFQITDSGESHPHLAVQAAADLLHMDSSKLNLPLDPNGNLIINWAGKWKDTYKHFSYVELLKSFEAKTKGEKTVIGPEDIRNKICIIGLTAFGHTDIKANPIEPAYPAVGIHANVINSILTKNYIRSASLNSNILSILFLGILVVVIFMRSGSSAMFILALGVGILWIILSYTLFISEGLLLGVAHQLMTILSLYIFSTAHALIQGHRERNKLFKLATVDGLTGLYVIRHFRQLMNEAAHEASTKESQLSLILLDIDHFKKVNDTYGHPAGDMVLKKISCIIREQIREKRRKDEIDYACRYGGEEIIVLLKNCNVTDAFFKVASRIRLRIENEEFIWNNTPFKVTVSLGVASLHSGEQVPDLMVHRADEALYRAKNEGRNCIRLERSDTPL